MTLTRSASIADRLTRMSTVSSGVALLFACAALMIYDVMTFRASIRDNLSIQAEIVGSNTQTALVFDDAAAAEQTLAALSAAPHLEAAVLHQPDGRRFAEYRRPDVTGDLPLPSLPPDAVEIYTFRDGRLHLVRRITVDGKSVGFLSLRYDLGEMNARVWRYGGLALLVLLAAMAGAIVVSRRTRRSIAEPIVELADIATRVSTERDYSLRAANTGFGELVVLTSSFNDMLAQIQARDRSLQEARDLLEQRVQARTAELNATNKELEAFCYSVSHDLRSPLRSIDGFSLALAEDCHDVLSPEAKVYLERIRASTQRMGMLIDDLLALSRITRGEIRQERVDLSALARAIASELASAEPDRPIEVVIRDGITAVGDSRLLRQVLENLIGNAWKFTSKTAEPTIEVGSVVDRGVVTYFVKDNGAGFDPAYADRLFGVFQRLHAMTEFPGTGVGLAIVDRIIQRHGGKVWADAVSGRGASFYFRLGPEP